MGSECAARTNARTSSGVKTLISPERLSCLGLSTSRTSVGDAVALAGSSHDPVEDREDLDLGPVAHHQARLEDLDVLGREILDLHLAERGEDVGPEDRVVVAERGRLPLLVAPEPLHVLVAGLGDRLAALDHAGQGPEARLVEDVAEPVLGLRFV
jgi:hypothetical protein